MHTIYILFCSMFCSIAIPIMSMELKSNKQNFNNGKEEENYSFEQSLLTEETEVPNTLFSFDQNDLGASLKENDLKTSSRLALQMMSVSLKQQTIRGKNTKKEIISEDVIKIAQTNEDVAKTLCTWKGNTARRAQCAGGILACSFALSKFVYDLAIGTHDQNSNPYNSLFSITNDATTFILGTYMIKNAVQNIPAQGNHNMAVMLNALIKLASQKSSDNL